MPPTRGVLWDLDGVLVDTGEFHFQAWSQVLADHRIPYNRDSFRATFGMNNAGTLAALLGRAPEADVLAAISDRKELLFRQAVRGRAQLLPGVRAWLDWLKAAGFRQAIASSAPPANIDALVDELGLRPDFDAVVSGFAMPGKPDPSVFLLAAEAIGVPPDSCVVIEDAVAGVQAAKRAGMKCIAVTTTNPAHALSGADLVVAGLDVLPPGAIDQLLNSP